MPSFTAESRWTDQTQQGGSGGSGADKVQAATVGEGEAGQAGGTNGHAPANCGSGGIRCGGPDLPFVDPLARQAQELRVEVAVNGVPETLTLPEASAATGREFGVLVVDDSTGRHLSGVFESKTTDPDTITFSASSKQTPVAFVHTHPGSTSANLALSVTDVNTGARLGISMYAMPTSGTTMKVYTPDPTGPTGYIRSF